MQREVYTKLKDLALTYAVSCLVYAGHSLMSFVGQGGDLVGPHFGTRIYFRANCLWLFDRLSPVVVVRCGASVLPAKSMLPAKSVNFYILDPSSLVISTYIHLIYYYDFTFKFPCVGRLLYKFNITAHRCAHNPWWWRSARL